MDVLKIQMIIPVFGPSAEPFPPSADLFSGIADADNALSSPFPLPDEDDQKDQKQDGGGNDRDEPDVDKERAVGGRLFHTDRGNRFLGSFMLLEIEVLLSVVDEQKGTIAQGGILVGIGDVCHHIGAG